MNLVGVDLGITKVAMAAFTEHNGLLSTEAFDSRAQTRDEQLVEVAGFTHDYMIFYEADWCFIEEPIVGNNPKYSLKLAQTCGAVMSELSHLRGQQGLDIRVVGNKTWKKEVVGNGNSSKDVIRSWVITHHPAYAAMCGSDQDRYDAVCVGLYGLGILDRARQLSL